MLSNCHLSVCNYFCDKKYPDSSLFIDCLEAIKRSSGRGPVSLSGERQEKDRDVVEKLTYIVY
jgi:hypothetical protein